MHASVWQRNLGSLCASLRSPSPLVRLNLPLWAGHRSSSEGRSKAWHACPGMCVAWPEGQNMDVPSRLGREWPRRGVGQRRRELLHSVPLRGAGAGEGTHAAGSYNNNKNK